MHETRADEAQNLTSRDRQLPIVVSGSIYRVDIIDLPAIIERFCNR